MSGGAGPSVRRRAVLAGGAAAFACPAVASATAFADLEARLEGGRLGVHAVNVATGRSLSHRADERFPIASTFKTLLAACVLARVDADLERLDRSVPVSQADMVSHAPVSSTYVAAGKAPIEVLCKAVVEVSDNAAANLLLKTVGGPEGLTRWLRRIGDPVTRLDRYELELNSAIPGDLRDTSTPRVMAATYRKLVQGPVLKTASRERLISWLEGATTGLNRIRKDLPPGWRAGDKTGNGANGSSNDVAVLWPPKGGPIYVAAYMHQTSVAMPVREAVLAEVGRIARERLA